MAMNRPKGYCPCCSFTVEFYSDGIGGPHPWRCGNCFQGYDHEQLDRFEALQKELDKHDAARQQLLYDALR
jgi:hypothetical protein